MSTIQAKILYVMFLIFFGYFIILSTYYLFLGLIGIIEGRRRARESREEDYPTVYLSTFSIPVSIILPARNEEIWIRDCVLSILNLNYPKFELIVVNDGSTDKTIGILDSILELSAVDIPYVKHYKDGKVHRILRSVKYPHVKVVDKSAGVKKAGTVNAGLNIARYDYVCSMDADTILRPDALLKVMAHVMREPEAIIGVGSYFSVLNGNKVKDGRMLEERYLFNPIIAYQNLEYIRSFMGNRIGWSKFNAMPVVAGGFSMWRRDVLYELGGFDIGFTCEDIEFTFRAHDYLVKNKDKKRKILMLPYHIGWTEGPAGIKSLISQRERWQRVTDETVWKYKYMLFNPRFKSFGFLTMPYFLIYEVLGVLFEVASFVLIAAGYFAGILDIEVFLIFFFLMLLSQSFISLLSIFSYVRAQPVFGIGYTIYLAVLSFFELFFYRWILFIAKIWGTCRFLFGIKSHEQYVRVKKA